jgi:hypothetical protein
LGKCDHVGKLELFRELRLGNFKVAGEFAGREPDRNGDIAFIMPFGAQPITNNPAPQANTGTAPQDVERQTRSTSRETALTTQYQAGSLMVMKRTGGFGVVVANEFLVGGDFA